MKLFSSFLSMTVSARLEADSRVLYLFNEGHFLKPFDTFALYFQTAACYLAMQCPLTSLDIHRTRTPG